MRENPARFLSPNEELLLLRIARDSLTSYVEKQTRIALEGYALTPELEARHGAFVTLRRGGELRGCIGHTRSLEPLAEAVRDNAINAAVRDPRFPPVRPEELSAIQIEVSALCPGAEPDSPFIPANDISEIVLGRDGLYLDGTGSLGGGLLLPQVPVERGWSLQEFLDAVCAKAGAPSGAWQEPGATLYRFSAQVFGEGELRS